MSSMILYSALNAACDPSRLRRVEVIYEDQCVINGQFSTVAINAGVGPLVLDIEAAWPDRIREAWRYAEACKYSRLKTNGRQIGLFGAYPYPDFSLAVSPTGGRKWIDVNLALSEINEAVDFYAPCLYLPSQKTSIHDWLLYADKTLAICKLTGPNKMFIPFLWHCDIDRSQEIDAQTWRTMLSWCKSEADATVLWTRSTETNVQSTDRWLADALAI